MNNIGNTVQYPNQTGDRVSRRCESVYVRTHPTPHDPTDADAWAVEIDPWATYQSMGKLRVTREQALDLAALLVLAAAGAYRPASPVLAGPEPRPVALRRLAVFAADAMRCAVVDEEVEHLRARARMMLEKAAFLEGSRLTEPAPAGPVVGAVAIDDTDSEGGER